MHNVGDKASLSGLQNGFGIGGRLTAHAEDAVVAGELSLDAELIAGIADHRMKEKQRFQEGLKQACQVIVPLDMSKLMPEYRRSLLWAGPCRDIGWQQYYRAQQAGESGRFDIAGKDDRRMLPARHVNLPG